MEENMLIFAPKSTPITVGCFVLITTGLHHPRVAEVMFIQEHSERCTLKDSIGEIYYRYVVELKVLTKDKTPILGPILSQSGNGNGKYDWVKAVQTLDGVESEAIISHEEYALRTQMQEFKKYLSIENRSQFVDLWQNWGDYNYRRGGNDEAERNAGADL